MKNKINLMIILTFAFGIKLIGQIYNKQNTYADAKKLELIYSILNDNSKSGSINMPFYHSEETDYEYNQTYNNILARYGLNENNLTSNIFLKDWMIIKRDTNDRVRSSLNSHSQEESASHPKTEYSSGNLQSSAINGLANFMAGRFKQEVLQMAIDQMFKKIKTKKDSTIVKSIFPKTFKQIGNLYDTGSSSYYTADLLLLRQTAQIDIVQVPINMMKNSEIIFPALKNKPKIKDILALENFIIEYNEQGQRLDILISTLANETYSSDSTIYKILNVSDLLSQALLNDEENKDIWVNPMNLLPTKISCCSSINLEITFFYGLLYQQLIQIPEFKSYLTSDNTIDKYSIETEIAAKIQGLCGFINKLNKTHNYIKSKEFNLKLPEENITYIKEINQTLNLFMSTLKNISTINKYYILNDDILNVPGNYISIVEAVNNKDFEKVIPLLVTGFVDYMENNRSALRTIAFVAQLATIQSADDMENLLSSYALPIGSSSIKRHSSFNLSVNGYVGLTGGWEIAYGSQKNQTKGNIGLSAPIGISATFCNGYFTPFISVLDLGSIVNQRLNNETSSFSNLKFEHFFTPGIGLFMNHSKLPFSAGVHCSYIPNLRTIKYESGNATITDTNRSVTRINFSLLMDIPFFTLYNKERNR